MEHVVVVDERGAAVTTVPKGPAHSTDTPLHLGFSCHVVRADGAVLLTRRSRRKATWPGVWSNACCGHPRLGEPLRAAVTRRLADELGLRPVRLGLAMPDFAYRAEMADGTVEHELCPVVFAVVEGDPDPDPDEVEDLRWAQWEALRRRALAEPASLSPWAVTQVLELGQLGHRPDRWLLGGRLDHDELLDLPAGALPAVGARAGEDPLAPVRDGLDRVLGDFLATKRVELRGIDPVLDELVGAVQDLLGAGGKRLRPAFVHWGRSATGDEQAEGVAHVAAAVEVLHAFALIHDDVMDRSDRRRGRPSAHVALADGHRRQGRGGDGDWFGTSAAILAGDLAHVWADELLDAAPLTDAAARRARRVFTELRAEVTAGQYLDLVLAGAAPPDEAAARQVALLKSARYSVTRPLELGASTGTAPPPRSLLDLLRRYGDAVGLAFQLRDDVLGLFGNPCETGKSALDDLRGGKRTLLVQRALRLADERGAKCVATALGDPTLDEERAEEVRAVVAASGALASVELHIRASHAVAVRAVDAVPEPAREALLALADRAVLRDR